MGEVKMEVPQIGLKLRGSIGFPEYQLVWLLVDIIKCW